MQRFGAASMGTLVAPAVQVDKTSCVLGFLQAQCWFVTGSD